MRRGCTCCDAHSRVDELAGRALALASEYGLAYWAAIASVQRGEALAGYGPESEAVELLQRGIRSYCGMGAGSPTRSPIAPSPCKATPASGGWMTRTTSWRMRSTAWRVTVSATSSRSCTG